MSKQQELYKLLDTMIQDINEEKLRLDKHFKVGHITNAERHEKLNHFYLRRVNNTIDVILDIEAKS